MDGQTTGLKLLEPASPEALLPDGELWPWLAAAALAVVVALALRLWLKHRRPTANPHARRQAAFASALGSLAAATTSDTRDAAVQCSLILRTYLSAAAGDPALYETHEEFVARHDSLQTLSADHRAAAQAGFSRLAGLKYAPVQPTQPAAQVIADARALLETLHHGLTA